MRHPDRLRGLRRGRILRLHRRRFRRRGVVFFVVEEGMTNVPLPRACWSPNKKRRTILLRRRRKATVALVMTVVRALRKGRNHFIPMTTRNRWATTTTSTIRAASGPNIRKTSFDPYANRYPPLLKPKTLSANLSHCLLPENPKLLPLMLLPNIKTIQPHATHSSMP